MALHWVAWAAGLIAARNRKARSSGDSSNGVPSTWSPQQSVRAVAGVAKRGISRRRIDARSASATRAATPVCRRSDGEISRSTQSNARYLIDEIKMFTFPIVLGNGKKLFDNGAKVGSVQTRGQQGDEEGS